MPADKVYLLYHIRETGELLLIGAYRSDDAAKSDIDRLRGKPGFINYPDGFEYWAYDLDADNWSDGFIEDDSID